MHYRLGFSSKLENSSVYIECSVRKPGVNHPIREIVKRFGKKKDPRVWQIPANKKLSTL